MLDFIMRTSSRGGCTVGPTCKVLLRETPVDYLADASNTDLVLVVLLDCLYTTWMGM